MDTLKTIGVAAVVALLVVGGMALIQANEPKLAGVPGVSILPVSQYPTAQAILATSTPTSSTLTSTDLATFDVIAMTLTQGAGTLTFPASTSFPGIPNPGDKRVIWVRHASTTAGVTLTLAGNTGTQVKRAASSTTALIGDTDGNNTMKVETIRKANTDILLLLTKYED